MMAAKPDRVNVAVVKAQTLQPPDVAGEGIIESQGQKEGVDVVV